jgi:hypothetical protein
MNKPIAGAASAVVITVIAVGGCSDGTVTVREVPGSGGSARRSRDHASPGSR